MAALADLVGSARTRLESVALELGLDDDALERAFPAAVRAKVRAATHEARVRAIGRAAIEARGRTEPPLDETLEQVRASVREFAEKEVLPHAERIHRHDEDIPESFITTMGELGYFGLSIPEQYGGHELGNLAMILTTEELSRASLAGAGSLITRPEILTKALLQGGTEAQKQHWLPKLASGEVMVGVSVTEPDVGSDVAGVKCRAIAAAERRLADPRARRRGAPSPAARTCSRCSRAPTPIPRRAPRGSRCSSSRRSPRAVTPSNRRSRAAAGSSARPTPRPATAACTPSRSASRTGSSRPRTWSARKAGSARASTSRWAASRRAGSRPAAAAAGSRRPRSRRPRSTWPGRAQFGRPIGDYQLTQYTLGRMALRLFQARAITYAAARAMDEDERAAAPLAAQAKLLACDIAVEVTQQGQLMHGGWGYAEEYPISRYVVDATVLPIFEGVKPILELKVIGRALLGG